MDNVFSVDCGSSVTAGGTLRDGPRLRVLPLRLFLVW